MTSEGGPAGSRALSQAQSPRQQAPGPVLLEAVGGDLQVWGCTARWGASYLSNHHRESEDTREIIQELEDNFKERLGVGQPPDGDEGLHGPVVAANVTGERREKGLWSPQD